jgi:hypothetical protein
MILAIATPVGNDNKPSFYVIDEVTYAQTKGKTVILFIDERTEVPGFWREQFTYTSFNIANSGTLIRDVLELVGRFE